MLYSRNGGWYGKIARHRLPPAGLSVCGRPHPEPGGSVPDQSETPEVELAGLITRARRLAKQIVGSIHRAKQLRRSAAEAQRDFDAKKISDGGKAGVSTQEDAGLREAAKEAQETAWKQLGELLDIKRQIEIALLRTEERTQPVREALEKLDFATSAPASNRWPSGVHFTEDGVLRALEEFRSLIGILPSSDLSRATETLSQTKLKNGQFCDQVIDEIRKIRHLYPGTPVARIRSDHPHFLVWSIIDDPNTDAEDRDIFSHPNQWGPVVGYAIKLLARSFGRSEETIRRWRKAYKKHARRSAGRT